MDEPDQWHVWILVLLWMVHSYIVAKDLLIFVAGLVALPFNNWVDLWTYLISSLSFTLCGMLDYIEFRRYRKQKLYPWFYFSTQVIKCLFWTEGVYIQWYYGDPYGNRTQWSMSDLSDAAKLSTFYFGLVYSLHILIRQRHKAMRKSAETHGGLSLTYDTNKIGDLSLSAQVNSATGVIADAHMLLNLVNWIEKDHVQQQKWDMILQAQYYSRYAIGFPLIAFVKPMPFHRHLPGEPHRSLDEEELWPYNWNYPRSLLTQGTSIGKRYATMEPRSSMTRGQSDPPRSYSTFRPVSRSSTGRLQNERVQPTSRLLSPRYLCILDDREESAEVRYSVCRLEDWLEENNTRVHPDYIFISYTRRQFSTQYAEISDPLESQQIQNKSAVDEDRATLTNYAMSAARRACVRAFWIDFECVKPDEETSHVADMDDVYRICDIVRAAHSLAIVIGPSLENGHRQSGHVFHKDEWLLEWGERMWTVPEALLCPSEHRIAIYDTGSDEPELVAKRNLAGRVWDDADTIRQLIDHYEASLHLTQLELISLALECLQRRQTNTRNAGDVAYVLMGLLRLRPKVNKADSDFQAFARLSLANDSDKILERIMCLQGRGENPTWHDTTDLWDSRLWFLDPLYHVVDIVDNNAVLVGNASGTTIDWNSLKLVDFRIANQTHRSRWSLIRFSTSTALWLSIIVAAIRPLLTPVMGNLSGMPLDAVRSTQMMLAAMLGVPLITALLITIPIPAWLSEHFRSDLSATQARLFGLQGRPDLQKVEAAVFGASCGRLTWDPDISDRLADGDSRQEFTIIDTLSRMAFRFRATSPPTLAFIGARERGLLRTILCSYDPRAEVFIKEAVVRMPGSNFRCLPRLDDFSFATTSTQHTDEQLFGSVPI